jgi:monoamine oxidase
MSTSVAIVGGGLAGLYAARLLHEAGVDFRVIEARERLGGRILTEDGCDLGPSWFWPGPQPQMAALVRELGLASYPQHNDGDVIFERMSRETPARYRPVVSEQQTLRVRGGMAAVIGAIAERLPAERLLTSSRVNRIALDRTVVELIVARPDGTEKTFQAQHVIAALPPRLLANISFSPAVSAEGMQRWKRMPTWMAPHAKFFALYERPFWRDAGLSGTAQSLVGPLAEVHDATSASGKAALFGFLGVGADQRSMVDEAALVQSCLAQLARMFGVEALQPTKTILKDWAAEPFTATSDDRTSTAHPEASSLSWVLPPWQERLVLAGSETSSAEPGFMAGAVSAAQSAVAEVVSRLGRV